MANRHPDLTDALVGSNIRILRIARRMSQIGLAERLGITFQQVQKYEKGLNRIGSSRLVRIADVFGLPIEDLFEGTSERAIANLVERIAATSE